MEHNQADAVQHYEVLVSHRLGAKGAVIELHPRQAKYLLLDGKIRLASPETDLALEEA